MVTSLIDDIQYENRSHGHSVISFGTGYCLYNALMATGKTFQGQLSNRTVHVYCYLGI